MIDRLQKGTKIGPYEIVSPLGRGGMATVYRAYQPALDREVAIKLMAEQYATDQAFAERFRREARAIARLRHPNILTVYDAGEDEGRLYIVMELINGPTLREEMRGQPFALERAARIIEQVGSALQYANDKGLIHRDVKPSNVLIDEDGRAVLSDFGIARLVEATSTQLTGTGVGIGTPSYMSPEQAMGEGLDGRADEYSLAVMLYEMLTGQLPFSGDSPMTVMMGHVNKPLPAPRQFNPAIPPAVEQVLIKALAKKPEERYTGSGEFVSALREAVQNKDNPTFAAPNPLLTTPAAPQTQLEAVRPPLPGNPAYPVYANHPEAEQLYQEARRLEQQNNFGSAFNVFRSLQTRFPNYRDVTGVLERYRAMGYETGPGLLVNPAGGYNPTQPVQGRPALSDPTQPTPGGNYNPNFSGPPNFPNQGYNGYYGNPMVAPATQPKKSALPLILGLGFALVAGIVLAVILLSPTQSGRTDNARVGTVTSAATAVPNPTATSRPATSPTATAGTGGGLFANPTATPTGGGNLFANPTATSKTAVPTIKVPTFTVNVPNSIVVPRYPGATSVTFPALLKSELDSEFSSGNVKNTKYEAYKTGDGLDKIKTFFSDTLKKEGWQDQSANLGAAVSQLESVGAFAIGFEKGNKTIVVMGLPGSLATNPAIGMENVSEKETAFLVISGEE